MLTSLERIYDVLDEQPKIRNRENPVSRQIQGNVVFKDVSFGYRSYETVLEKINFEIKKGEMIGIAVSYTHLDVYKRQSRKRVFFVQIR